MIEPFSMFINRLMDDHREGINQNTWAVYLVLSRFCDTEGRSAISVRKIQEISRLTKPTILKHLRILEQYKYIKTEIAGNGKKNSYEFDNHPKVALSKRRKEREKEVDIEENEMLVVPIFDEWDGGFDTSKLESE